MNKIAFESKLMPDGHLYCPKEFSNKTNAKFKVIVTFENNQIEASDEDIELSSVNDLSFDSLTGEELDYYLNLKEI